MTDDLSKLSSDEIDNLKVVAEKEMQISNIHLGIVIEEKNRIDRQMIDLMAKKKDLQIVIDKARFNVKRLESDMRILTSAFWKTRSNKPLKL